MIGVIKGTMRQAKEVSGLPLPIASYKANLKAPIRSLKVAITATQSGSGDPAPDNIRPISGWSECNVVKCGVNVWDEAWENGTFDTTTGENINTGGAINQIRSKNLFPILPNVSYYFYVPTSSAWFIFYDKDKNVVANPEVTSSGTVSTSGNSKNIRRNNWFSVSTSNVRYIRFYMLSNYGATYGHDISINYPSTDTDYHAYNGNTYTIQLGDTYYGCSLNVTTGVLTVTNVSVDMGSLAWTSFYQKMVYMSFPDTPTPSQATDKANLICSSYKTVSRNEIGNPPWNYAGVGVDTAGRLFVANPDSAWTSVNDAKADLNGVQLVYELATPITVQLTPTQVEQLLINNVWADTGDVEELKYFDRQVYYGR